MAALQSGKLGALRQLVEASPDRVLEGLDTALAMPGAAGGGMAEVRSLVQNERADRQLCAEIFEPIRILFVPNQGPVERLVLPGNPLAAVWRGLRALAPHELRAAAQTDDASRERLHDKLCQLAAGGLRDRANPEFEAAAARIEALMPGGAGELASYLELVPVARRALQHLPQWMGRITEERAAAARLAFKDAVEVADDAAPRLFEILFAHLNEPWLSLRLISAVMDRPADGFVASSELARFGERVLVDLERRVAKVCAFDPRRAAETGQSAGRDVHVAVLQINEFEQALDLAKDGPWGLRVAAAKRALASAVELRLRQVEGAIAAALPLDAPRAKGVRGRPRLNADPDPDKVAIARSLTAFLFEVRTASATGGFGSVRTAVAESLEDRLAQYSEDLLETVHAKPGPESARARAYLELAARFLEDAADGDLGQIVRRRAAAA